MEKVLVTGAGGYIGSCLCGQLLDEGYKVRAMDNFYKGQCDALIPYISNPNFEFVAGDVTNLEDVRKCVDGVGSVLHLAALVGFPRCVANKELAKLTNNAGTYNVAEVVKELNRHNSDPIKLIFSSTGSVYGRVLDNICTENTPMNPQSLYGETKVYGEKTIREQCSDALIYRFATAFGVGHTTRINLLINTLVYEAILNRCLTIFEADAYRTFIHVRDMARSFIFGIQNYWKMKYRIYNIGSDHMNSTKREIAESIREKTKCYITYADVMKDADCRDYKVSYEKIMDEGFTTTISIEQGIKELIDVTPLIRVRHNYD